MGLILGERLLRPQMFWTGQGYRPVLVGVCRQVRIEKLCPEEGLLHGIEGHLSLDTVVRGHPIGSMMTLTSSFCFVAYVFGLMYWFVIVCGMSVFNLGGTRKAG